MNTPTSRQDQERLSALVEAIKRGLPHDQEISACRDASGLCRGFMDQGHQSLLPMLWFLRNRTANLLSDDGATSEALAAAKEAAELARALVASQGIDSLLQLVVSLANLGNRLSDAGQPMTAASVAEEAAVHARSLVDRKGSTYLKNLAITLNGLGNRYRAIGRFTDAERVLREADSHFERLAVRGFAEFGSSRLMVFMNLFGLLQITGRRREAVEAVNLALACAKRLETLGMTLPAKTSIELSLAQGFALRHQGHFEDALKALDQAVAVSRTGTARQPDAFAQLLAESLTRKSETLRDVGDTQSAFEAIAEAVRLSRAQAKATGSKELHGLSVRLVNLAVVLTDMGRSRDAAAPIEEALNNFRLLSGDGDHAHLEEHLSALIMSATVLRLNGSFVDGLSAIQEAEALLRSGLPQGRALSDELLSGALDVKGAILCDQGEFQSASVASDEAVSLLRELAKVEPGERLPEFAIALGNASIHLSELGRREEALALARESEEILKSLSAREHSPYAPKHANALTILAIMLGECDARGEALKAAREAVTIRDRLYAADPEAFRHDLGKSLMTYGLRLLEARAFAEARAMLTRAVILRREQARGSSEKFSRELAMCLSNLATACSEMGDYARSLECAREATELYRRMVETNTAAYRRDLTLCLATLGKILDLGGKHADATAVWREVGALVLDMTPHDARQWIQLAGGPIRNLASPPDLRTWHLPLLRLLPEHRELAFDAEHATLFLELQGLAAAKTWALLATLQAGDAALVDEAMAVLVATLHSPDLARWLQARGIGDGTLAELARLKHDVIEADQLLDSLMKRLGGGLADSGRSDGADPDAQRAVQRLLNEQALKARKCREAFRTERERLIEADPKFRSAFALPEMPALREAARHGQGAAMLCLLELSAEGSSEPLTVGALVHLDGRRTQQLAFEELHATARGLVLHEPYGNRLGRGGALRRNDAATRADPAPQTGEPEPGAADVSGTSLEVLQQQMQQRFWGVLKQALLAAGDGAVQRLHVCGHGLLQQLPLGLRAPDDCPGLQLLAWPGLPYLRLAAETAHAAVPAAPALPATAPWLIGHDCAWGSKRPLPMVAVEATLLRLLLEQYGKRVTVIERATQLHTGSAAVVLCCHGAQADANFDGALALGDPPLTVGQVVQDRLGPPLALLPACYAGETREAAGNALGVSAGFLFGGSRVVLASSKSVPDMLAPWLSTLTVWHVLHGRSLHDAAVMARQQFGTLDFPPEFKEWLTKALPQALATIQPSGAEYERANQQATADLLAIDAVRRDWPWAGDALGLMSKDAARRQQATASVASNVLTPSPTRARELKQMLSEMAAFVFVYGVE